MGMELDAALIGVNIDNDLVEARDTMSREAERGVHP
jgi:hypothetical protein